MSHLLSPTAITAAPPLIYRHVEVYPHDVALYAGFAMQLTPVECAILRALVLHAQQTSADFLPGDTLRHRLGCHRSSRDTLESPSDEYFLHHFGFTPSPQTELISPNQLAVHVSRINRKARYISGRTLILERRQKGYMLNPYM